MPKHTVVAGSTDILRPSHPPPTLHSRTFSPSMQQELFRTSPEPPTPPTAAQGGPDFPVAWAPSHQPQQQQQETQGPPSAFPRRISGWLSGVLSPPTPSPTPGPGSGGSGTETLSPSPLPRTSSASGYRVMQGKNASAQSLSFPPPSRERSVSPSPAPPPPPASSPPSTFRAPSPKKSAGGGLGGWVGLGGGGGLDKAVQFFLDSDSNGVGSGEEIWVMGVRHDGVVKDEEREKESKKERKRKEKEKERERDELEIVRVGASTPGGSKILSALPKRAIVKALPGAVTGGNKLMSSAAKLASSNSKEKKGKKEQQSSSAPRFREGWDRNASVSPPPSSAASTSSGPLSSMPFPPPSLAQTGGWPPSFYHDFYSRIVLHYRSGFPVIPCQPNTNPLRDVLGSLSASLGRGGGPSGRTADGLTSDAGWGCMLRTGQSLLANALERVHLGREWRRPVPAKDKEPSSPMVVVDPHTYQRLISWFIDDPSPLAPFSVHKFAVKGKELGKEIGEWFGPSTAAGAIKSLTNEFAPAGMGVANAIDGTLYRTDVYDAAQTVVKKEKRRSKDVMRNPNAKVKWQRPVLVLFGLRLGINGVNPIYFESVKAIFRFPQSVGIAGGRPSSSYYFIGYQGTSLFYIDPHHTRASIPLRIIPQELHQQALTKPLTSGKKDDSEWEKLENNNDSGSFQSVSFKPSSSPTTSSFGGFSGGVANSNSSTSKYGDTEKEDPLDAFFSQAYPDVSLRTYHCEKVRRMGITGLDPSMLVGFLIRDEVDWEDFVARTKELPKSIFSIQNEMPHWLRGKGTESDGSTSDHGVESLSEPEDWEEDGTSSSKQSGSNYNSIRKSKENTPFSEELDAEVTPNTKRKPDPPPEMDLGEETPELDDSMVSENPTLNAKEPDRDSWVDTGSTGGSVPSTARPNKTFNHDDSRPQSDYQTLLKDDESVLMMGSGSIHSLEGWQRVEEKRKRKSSGLALGWSGDDDDDDEMESSEPQVTAEGNSNDQTRQPDRNGEVQKPSISR
ncbi:hypothetical protein BT69DRAFT_1317122 [Atractiella rhizophila]|nr:hypothetical protein BT69DRAFT_1317122 [Atractiella rhizophila]